jgi:hypothetical protein
MDIPLLQVDSALGLPAWYALLLPDLFEICEKWLAENYLLPTFIAPFCSLKKNFQSIENPCLKK